MNNIIAEWENYIQKKLMPIIDSKIIEGNIYGKPNERNVCKLLRQKQKNIVDILSQNDFDNVLEIGFNAGFSALLMLMSNPSIKLTCVDINMHKYTQVCFDQIKKDFNNIDIILDSSVNVLPKLKISNMKYDLIHIDGDHSLRGAKIDIDNSLELSVSGSMLLIDDTNIGHINGLVDDLVNQEIVRNIDYHNSERYRHRCVQII